MKYIKINDYAIPYPNGFTMTRVPNKVAEYTTMSGKTLADVNGWKYDKTSMEWGTLLNEHLQILLQAVNDMEFQLEFEDIDGEIKTIKAITESTVAVKTRATVNGKIVWKDISLSVSFPDCYGV